MCLQLLTETQNIRQLDLPIPGENSQYFLRKFMLPSLSTLEAIAYY